jgi:16S rRNA (guanine527-N7)-methyltransferase
MISSAIAELLQPFLDRELAPAQLRQISMYIDLLQRWNARINLTAIRNEEEIVTRHFGESLFMARHLFPHPSPEAEASPRVIDIGSGAGFPALPLKIWAPHLHLTLIESNHKKATFLREVVRTLTLTNINVINNRAEAIAPTPDSQSSEVTPREPGRRGSQPPLSTPKPQLARAEVVTFRAVEKFERILPLASTFLSPTGRLAILIGPTQIAHLNQLNALTWTTYPIQKSTASLLTIGVTR